MSGTEAAKSCLEELVAKIEAKADNFAGVSWVLGYDFTPSDDGEWHIIIDDGVASGPFEGENSEAIITTISPLQVFIEQSKQRFNPMTAMWNTGKLRFHGDAMVAHRFHKLLAQ